MKAFDARRVEAMRGRIRDIASELVDGFIDSGSGDLVRLFTHPLPVIVICDMLGVPEGDRAEFVRGSRVNGRLIDPAPMTPDELPIIDRPPRFSNVVVATGHGMMGVSMAPATGRLVAEMVTGAEPFLDPTPYSLARF